MCKECTADAWRREVKDRPLLQFWKWTRLSGDLHLFIAYSTSRTRLRASFIRACHGRQHNNLSSWYKMSELTSKGLSLFLDGGVFERSSLGDRVVKTTKADGVMSILWQRHKFKNPILACLLNKQIITPFPKHPKHKMIETRLIDLKLLAPQKMTNYTSCACDGCLGTGAARFSSRGFL